MVTALYQHITFPAFVCCSDFEMSFGYKALPQSSSYDFISNASLNVNEPGTRAGEGSTHGVSSAANDSCLRAQSRGVEQGQLHQVLRRFRKRQQNLNQDSKEYFCRRVKDVHEPLRAQSDANHYSLTD